ESRSGSGALESGVAADDRAARIGLGAEVLQTLVDRLDERGWQIVQLFFAPGEMIARQHPERECDRATPCDQRENGERPREEERRVRGRLLCQRAQSRGALAEADQARQRQDVLPQEKRKHDEVEDREELRERLQPRRTTSLLASHFLLVVLLGPA